MSSPRKRQRESQSSPLASSAQSHATDNADTPRVSKSQRPNLLARTPSQASRASKASKASSASRVSPTKQIASRQNKPWPVLVQQYDPDETDIPASLRRVWTALSSFALGKGVISRSKKDEISKAKETSARFESIDGDWFFDDNSTRDQLGPSPTVAQVMKILDFAKTCANEKHDEDSWNQCLHNQILQLAVPQMGAKQDNVFFLPCATAKILDTYIDSRGPARKVDFCFVVEPGPQTAEAITAIQHEDDLFSMSINHTDYHPFRRRPIVLSIETKVEGAGINDAQAQLLIWLEAQWRLLRRLASRADPPRPLPDFLPAIIIEGHKWYFVACPKDEEKTVLWSELFLGSTQHAIGVYSIVCCLQYLSRWITDDYWPAFQRIFSAPTPPATPDSTG
ncbi:uncharacterized protein LY79DRAFT_529297 [Colletotrichum navitas]|uniref:PD-(D/E)XK nuclease-like domain-containing protein n=1 Tax=Colletotrichum navitas TaxID=681940 RepID=A0AAD8UXB5_9PEZI|nr:uncharacterized protein LY79DRAFT_529297 [Colletotrichum navitas]KAK1566163.1 hypothetical protein LY79DRAFT_529297 [Colletotrichum navitas]